MILVSLQNNVRQLLRGQEIKATAIAGLLVQVGRPLVSLLTLPLLLSHLGKDGLGVWMIALSLMGLVGFVSAGLSASVVTAIGRASSDTRLQSLRELTTTAAMIAAGWGLVVATIAVPAALTIDWEQLLKLDGPRAGRDVGFLMTALSAMLAISLVAAVPRQVMTGRMHGYIAHALDFCGVVSGAAGLIIALYLDAPLWVLGLVFLAPAIAVQLIGGLFYLQRARIPLFSIQNVDRKILHILGKDSLRMAGYQSAYAVSSQSDLLLIGIILGTPASAVYGIAQRIFSLPILVSTAVNYAQWPAMARADAEGKTEALGRMFRRTLVIGPALATSAALAAAIIYQPLTQLWLGRDLETDPLILTGMVAWVLVATLVNTCDSLLRARGESSLLMRAMTVMAVINIAATLLLLPLIGPAGAIWGSVMGFTLALLFPYSVRLWPVIAGHGAGASRGGV